MMSSFEVNGSRNSAAGTRRSRERTGPKFVTSSGFGVPMYGNFPNLNVPDSSPYYFMNMGGYTPHRVHSEQPLSLPVYPLITYPNMPYPSDPSKHPSNPPSSSSYSSLHNAHEAQSNDYMSLPVGPLDHNENSTEKRRFSDPGINCESDESSSNSLDNRLVQKLTQQVNVLKDSNRRLSREVVELRIEVNMLKQQQNARPHYDRDYAPGMLAEIIKEIRDAARVREDALLAKVKHMIEEQQFNMVSNNSFLSYTVNK